MALIAGHDFTQGPCSCGRKFSDISGAQPSDVGQPHWAHVGELAQTEYTQIVVERERLWRSLTGAPVVEIPQPEDNSIFG